MYNIDWNHLHYNAWTCIRLKTISIMGSQRIEIRWNFICPFFVSFAIECKRTIFNISLREFNVHKKRIIHCLSVLMNLSKWKMLQKFIYIWIRSQFRYINSVNSNCCFKNASELCIHRTWVHIIPSNLVPFQWHAFPINLK